MVCVVCRIKILIERAGTGWRIVNLVLIDACADDDDQLSQWFTVLRKNCIKTTKDWFDNYMDVKLRDECGAKLRNLLDQLAGISLVPSGAGEWHAAAMLL